MFRYPSTVPLSSSSFNIPLTEHSDFSSRREELQKILHGKIAYNQCVKSFYKDLEGKCLADAGCFDKMYSQLARITGVEKRVLRKSHVNKKPAEQMEFIKELIAAAETDMAHYKEILSSVFFRKPIEELVAADVIYFYFKIWGFKFSEEKFMQRSNSKEKTVREESADYELYVFDSILKYISDVIESISSLKKHFDRFKINLETSQPGTYDAEIRVGYSINHLTPALNRMWDKYFVTVDRCYRGFAFLKQKGKSEFDELEKKFVEKDGVFFKKLKEHAELSKGETETRSKYGENFSVNQKYFDDFDLRENNLLEEWKALETESNDCLKAIINFYFKHGDNDDLLAFMDLVGWGIDQPIDNDRCLLLMCLKETDNINLFSTLLNKGANPNMTDEQGRSICYKAVTKKPCAFLGILLKSNNVIVDAAAVALANEKGHEEALQLIKKHSGELPKTAEKKPSPRRNSDYKIEVEKKREEKIEQKKAEQKKAMTERAAETIPVQPRIESQFGFSRLSPSHKETLESIIGKDEKAGITFKAVENLVEALGGTMTGGSHKKISLWSHYRYVDFIEDENRHSAYFFSQHGGAHTERYLLPVSIKQLWYSFLSIGLIKQYHQTQKNLVSQTSILPNGK